jgi:hypothetical protein
MHVTCNHCMHNIHHSLHLRAIIRSSCTLACLRHGGRTRCTQLAGITNMQSCVCHGKHYSSCTWHVCVLHGPACELCVVQLAGDSTGPIKCTACHRPPSFPQLNADCRTMHSGLHVWRSLLLCLTSMRWSCSAPTTRAPCPNANIVQACTWLVSSHQPTPQYVHHLPLTDCPPALGHRLPLASYPSTPQSACTAFPRANCSINNLHSRSCTTRSLIPAAAGASAMSTRTGTT